MQTTMKRIFRARLTEYCFRADSVFIAEMLATSHKLSPAKWFLDWASLRPDAPVYVYTLRGQFAGFVFGEKAISCTRIEFRAEAVIRAQAFDNNVAWRNGDRAAAAEDAAAVQAPKLIHVATGVEAKVGDTVYVSGERSMMAIDYFQVPHKRASEGRVQVRYFGTNSATEYYASVLGLKWVNRTDGREC